MTKKKEGFIPLNNWMLVDPESTVQTFGTSFTSADEQVKKPSYGTVVAVGEGVSTVKEGDRIFFQGNGVVSIPVDEKDQVLVNKSNLLGAWKTI